MDSGTGQTVLLDGCVRHLTAQLFRPQVLRVKGLPWTAGKRAVHDGDRGLQDASRATGKPQPKFTGKTPPHLLACVRLKAPSLPMQTSCQCPPVRLELLHSMIVFLKDNKLTPLDAKANACTYQGER